MGKFKYKLARFFMGRYGNDTLNTTLLWVYLVFVILSAVLSMTVFAGKAWFDLVEFLVSLFMIVIIFYRTMSRNIAKRSRENEKFKGFFKLRKNKFKDRKTHVYRKCKNCGAVLRLPRSKGKHNVVCPRCKSRFQVRG
jgi:hypothetical protein